MPKARAQNSRARIIAKTNGSSNATIAKRNQTSTNILDHSTYDTKKTVPKPNVETYTISDTDERDYRGEQYTVNKKHYNEDYRVKTPEQQLINQYNLTKDLPPPTMRGLPPPVMLDGHYYIKVPTLPNVDNNQAERSPDNETEIVDTITEMTDDEMDVIISGLLESNNTLTRKNTMRILSLDEEEITDPSLLNNTNSNGDINLMKGRQDNVEENYVEYNALDDTDSDMSIESSFSMTDLNEVEDIINDERFYTVNKNPIQTESIRKSKGARTMRSKARVRNTLNTNPNKDNISPVNIPPKKSLPPTPVPKENENDISANNIIDDKKEKRRSVFQIPGKLKSILKKTTSEPTISNQNTNDGNSKPQDTTDSFEVKKNRRKSLSLRFSERVIPNILTKSENDKDGMKSSDVSIRKNRMSVTSRSEESS